MIQVRDISKHYEINGARIEALKNISMDTYQGEFIAIVGPSGSGKSTLLLTIGGLLRPTKGDVYIDGVSVYDLSHQERAALRIRKIGFMFQTFNLIPYLTSLENVQIPLYLAGMDKKAQEQKALELLGQFNLSHRIKHKPSEMSVGERQRVALARAIANDPDYILADEPTGNLDGEATGEILALFRELRARGKTIIMVTHDEDLALRADRVIEIMDGRYCSTTITNEYDCERI
jgi:putative ABC transport system ATP-binding protein